MCIGIQGGGLKHHQKHHAVHLCACAYLGLQVLAAWYSARGLYKITMEASFSFESGYYVYL